MALKVFNEYQPVSLLDGQPCYTSFSISFRPVCEQGNRHYILLVYARGIGDEHAQLPNNDCILQLKLCMSGPQAK